MKNYKIELLNVIESAVANVQKNQDIINKLNVFPVPDGDTGSNMLATLLFGWNGINTNTDLDVEVFESFAKNTLLGARGNSGVIVSQIVRGFAVGVKENGGISKSKTVLKSIFKKAQEYAYKSVSNPVEGTILSVIKAIADEFDTEAKTYLEIFENVLKIAKKATDHTPNQLPILKEAEVVDSGAYGICCLIEGILLALKGKPLKINTNEQGTQTHNESNEFRKADAFKNIGYCSEFIMTLKHPEKLNDEKFKKQLNKFGDSLVYIKEDDILKVHIHVTEPHKLLELAHPLGEFSKIKIENMTTQVSENSSFEVTSDSRIKKSSNPNKLGIVVVSNGAGLDAEFLAAGATEIISGGQTMNPSVDDFIQYINRMPNKEVLILPNNKNIILTALQVKKTITNKTIHVLETKTLQQGLIALYNISEEMTPFSDFYDITVESFSSLKEGMITNAIRDVEMNGIKIKKDDYIALSGSKVVASKKTLTETAIELINKLVDSSSEIITLFVNDEISSKNKKEFKDYISKKFPNITLEIKYGGQAVYHLLVIVE